MLWVIAYRLERPGEPKVTDLDGTSLIYEKIGWFDVSMDDVSRVEELESAQRVVEQDLDVLFRDNSLWH